MLLTERSGVGVWGREKGHHRIGSETGDDGAVDMDRAADEDGNPKHGEPRNDDLCARDGNKQEVEETV